MYQFKQIIKTDFLNLIKNPMWIFYCTVFPALMILILGFLTSGSYGKSVISYDYYGITMMIYSIFSGAMISANCFMEERIKGGNMRLLYAPIRPSYLFLSKIIASYLFCLLTYSIVAIFLMVTVQIDFFGANMGAILLIFLISEFFACTLGILLCCIFKTESSANQLLSMLLMIFSLLGGLFFPVDGLGKAVQKASSLSPMKWISEAVFQTIYDSNLTLVYPTILAFLVLSIAAVLVCTKLFRLEDYL